MQYFVDFDRTLFDTTSFKEAYMLRPKFSQLFSEAKEIWRQMMDPAHPLTKRRLWLRTFGTFVSHGRLLFTPRLLREFLYTDVPGFLEAHGQDCTVVTYGMQTFITAKVTSALTDLPLKNIIYTSRKKGRTISRLTKGETGPFTFVDDAHFQLTSVEKHCPDVSVYEIRRDGTPGSGEWPVIHSLRDLDAVSPSV